MSPLENSFRLIGSGSLPYSPAMVLQRRRPSGFIAPCLPSKVARPPTGQSWVHEIKHDGYRLMVRRDGCYCITQNAPVSSGARDVQSPLHRLVRNHPANIGLRNSELLGNFCWRDACLEGSTNCILLADCQSYGRQFRPLTFSRRWWRFLTTPLLFRRHGSVQLIELLVAEVLDRSWQVARQDMP